MTTKAALVAVFFLVAGVKTASACHGVAIDTLAQTVNAGDVVVTGYSNSATCGCGPYWMEVEVTCNPAGFTGAPPVPSSPLWGTVPWYHSLLDVATHTAAQNWLEQCATEPYTPITIPFSQLCPGTQYYWRAREFVEGSQSAGPWSGTFTFTTPGQPPASVLTASASAYSGCPGDIVQLQANVSGGCPGATYNYLWSPATGLSNPNIPNPLCTLATNITYTVSTSGGCFTITSADDTVALTIGPPPVAGTPAAFPSSLCSGQSSWIVLTGQGAGTIQWEVSPNGVNWFTLAGATNDSVNTGPLSSSLYYHAIVTGSGWPGSGCGSTTSPPIQVVVNQSPVADAGLNTSVCSGGCVNLTGTGGVTYNWQPGSLSGSTVNVCPGASTTYTLYITDANGCSDSDMVTINISGASVAVSPSTSICTGNTTVIVASGPNGQTYSWLPSGSLTGANTSNPTASPTVTTTYTVTATNSFGCTAIDSVTVQVTSAPQITASNDTSLCNGGAANLTATGATSYTWNPGNIGQQTISVSPVNTTTYIVTGNTNNCFSYDTVVVTVAPPFSVYAGPDFDVCGGTQVTLNVGVSGGSYSWTPVASIIGSSTSQAVLAAPTGTTSFTVNVTDANGCISADTITVTVNPAPIVTAGTTDDTICAGQFTTLNSTGAQSYAWTPNISLASPLSTTTTANPSNTTTYLVTGTDANGCMDTSTITIFVNPNPQVYFASSGSVCGGATGQISFNGTTGGTAPFTYQIGSTTVTMPASGLAPGNYAVTYTDANGCTGLAGVTVYSIDPLVNFSSIASECGDTSGQITFDSSPSGVAPFTYQIGSLTYNSLPITGLAPGNYNVTYTDANGCTGLTAVTVFMQNTAYVNASADPIFGTYPLPVNFGASGSPGLTNYNWTFGDSNVGTGASTGNTYGAPGIYEVVVMAYNSVPGCAVYDTLYIEVVEQATIALPNVFTPNEDATNDQFMATVSGVKDIKVEIFNRWGNLVFTGEQMGLPPAPGTIALWDGKTKSGNVSEDGVYYYVVTAVGYDLQVYPMQGFVHLLTTPQQ